MPFAKEQLADIEKFDLTVESDIDRVIADVITITWKPDWCHATERQTCHRFERIVLSKDCQETLMSKYGITLGVKSIEYEELEKQLIEHFQRENKNVIDT